MAKFLIRIFDGNLRTNYIERVFEADDRNDAIESMKKDSDVAREAVNKLSAEGSAKGAIERGAFDLIELQS